ncbi:calmodulin-like protein 3 [Rhododendron vialii]|uniref:calmodulin-like protein 3 n=1 Tax=Rhododendron vialii TaxID=182163 RepID=UPI00265ED2AC|nr:calmodulin-like protein 3 [Rhododendron vialii]
MMLMAIGVLSLLFVFGLFHTLLHSQTTKLVAWSRSSLKKVFSSQRVVPSPTDSEEIVRSGTSHRKAEAELRKVFATFDKNKDGFITKQELRESMRNVGVDMSEAEAAEMVEKVDSNRDGLIDFDEFCELFDSMAGGDRAAGEGRGEEAGEGGGGGEGDFMKEAFDVFDGDRDGLITVEELGLVLSSLGMKEGERLENCKEMIRKVDVDGDGMVNFDEFKEMMKTGGGGRLVAVS